MNPAIALQHLLDSGHWIVKVGDRYMVVDCKTIRLTTMRRLATRFPTDRSAKTNLDRLAIYQDNREVLAKGYSIDYVQRSMAPRRKNRHRDHPELQLGI